MHTGLVGVAEFDEKPLGLERDEFGHARLDRPDRDFVHPPGEPFSLVGKDSGAFFEHVSVLTGLAVYATLMPILVADEWWHGKE
jgi:hypothetical protein